MSEQLNFGDEARFRAGTGDRLLVAGEVAAMLRVTTLAEVVRAVLALSSQRRAIRGVRVAVA